MKLSNRAIYGLRALFDLAFHGGDSPSKAGDVAERAEIPARFLEQILQDLRRAGLVESKRGPRGGYSLVETPEQISVARVLAALEELPEFVSPGSPERAEEGVARGLEVVDAMCEQFVDELRQRLETITLADMIERGDELGVSRACYERFTYVI